MPEEHHRSQDPDGGGGMPLRGSETTLSADLSRSAAPEHAPEIRARAAACLFGAGGSLVLLTLLLPGEPAIGEVGVLAPGLAACAATVLLLALGSRLPDWVFPIVVAFGTLCITSCLHFSGSGDSSYSFLYVWVGLYAFFFFSLRQALVQISFVGLTLGAALVYTPRTSSPLDRWLVIMGTVTVGATLIRLLAGRVREQAREASLRAEELHKLTAQTRSIIETAQEAFVCIRADGAIADWNPQAEITFGYARSEALGRRLVDLVVPLGDREAFEAALDGFLSTGESRLFNRRIEVNALHRAGHEFPVEMTIAPLREGGTYVFNAFVHDITTRRAAEEQIRAQAEDLEIIARVTRDLAGVQDALGARPAICDAAIQVSGAQISIFYEPDAKGRELVSTATTGTHRPIRLPFTGQPSGAGVAFSSAQPFFVADLEGHPAVTQRLVEELDVKSALWQPVVRNGVSIAVLTVSWRDRVPALSARVSALMDLLAAEAAVAIERADLMARLEAVARTDELTGLANRRAWDEELPRELARAEREARPVCVAMLDLDRFKRFNDEEGHQAGDRLLKQLAGSWREILRPSDFIARYGGEEFIVVLPSCGLPLAMEVVERLRASVPAPQTCSAGVAAWDGKERPEDLVARADQALYRAKEAGRDRAAAG